MSAREPTEAEMQAALMAEMERITVDDVLVQTVVSVLNLAATKGGLAPLPDGSPPDPARGDWGQVRQAIEAVRVMLPLVEPALGPQAAAVRDALARLQQQYVRHAPQGAPAPGGPEPAEPQQQQQPAQPGGGSSRLWVPGR